MFESRRRWMPELARQFVHDNVRLRAFRSVADLAGAAVNIAHGVAVLDLDTASADCLRWLAARVNSPEGPAAIVVGSHRTAELEPLIRESGAAEFVLDTLGGETLAQVCRRLWRTRAVQAGAQSFFEKTSAHEKHR